MGSEVRRTGWYRGEATGNVEGEEGKGSLRGKVIFIPTPILCSPAFRMSTIFKVTTIVTEKNGESVSLYSRHGRFN